MRIVVALGGNALLKRGEPMTAENQRANIRRAAAVLAELIAAGHSLVITHGNGPQVGLLALQAAALSEQSFPWLCRKFIMMLEAARSSDAIMLRAPQRL